MPGDSKMDLNSAGVKLLTQLPHVSKTIAYEIVNYRRRHGGFADWEDLKKLPSLSSSSLSEDKEVLEAFQSTAFLGPRPAPVQPSERRILSRRLGKSKDETHSHG